MTRYFFRIRDSPPCANWYKVVRIRGTACSTQYPLAAIYFSKHLDKTYEKWKKRIKIPSKFRCWPEICRNQQQWSSDFINLISRTYNWNMIQYVAFKQGVRITLMSWSRSPLFSKYFAVHFAVKFNFTHRYSLNPHMPSCDKTVQWRNNDRSGV